MEPSSSGLTVSLRPRAVVRLQPRLHSRRSVHRQDARGRVISTVSYMDQSQTLRNPASIILGYRGGPMHLIEKRVVRRDGDIAGQKLG